MKFQFDDEYFQNEMRADFLVTECMKRYWAASLKTVEIFDEICSKYNLTYWADCGTMLGAFRHHGFIPWDDDIDLGMPRKDYDFFLKIAKDEFPESFDVTTYDDEAHKYNGTTIVLNHVEVVFTPEILSNYYNCPFPVGFDLYPYDVCPEDEHEQQMWRLDYLNTLKELRAIRAEGESNEDIDFKRLKDIGIEAENIARKYEDAESDDIIRFIFYSLNNRKKSFRKEWCLTTVQVPFETASIPVPLFIEEALLSEFGPDYVKSIKASSAHDYPLYRIDLSKMIKFLRDGGIELKDLPPMLQYIREEAEYRELV